jgi:hypothetical protein
MEKRHPIDEAIDAQALARLFASTAMLIMSCDIRLGCDDLEVALHYQARAREWAQYAQEYVEALNGTT